MRDGGRELYKTLPIMVIGYCIFSCLASLLLGESVLAVRADRANSSSSVSSVARIETR